MNSNLPTRIIAGVGFFLLGLVTLCTGGWGALALYYSGPQDGPWRYGLVGAFTLVAVAALIALGFARWRWRALAVYFVLFAVVLIWWRDIEPSNQREWQTDVALLAYATIDGDMVTVHNIRNFSYRTEFDYTPAYYDKTFDLRKLNGVDLVAVYWMGPAIAHTFLSFSFSDGGHLPISIETRKEKSESYSTIAGFFKQYELYYVVADERDVIRLRTNYRHDPPEEVYIYRMHGQTESVRNVFMKYITKLNDLTVHPQFYNTLTSNCTTDIWYNTQGNESRLPFSWKILASGYVPSYLYEEKRIDTSIPFKELEQRVHVNSRAHAANDAPNFSQLIRTEAAVAVNQNLPVSTTGAQK